MFWRGLDAEVRSRVETAISALKDSGAEIVEVSLPHSRYVIAVYYIIATAEASSESSQGMMAWVWIRAEEARTLSEM